MTKTGGDDTVPLRPETSERRTPWLGISTSANLSSDTDGHDQAMSRCLLPKVSPGSLTSPTHPAIQSPALAAHGVKQVAIQQQRIMLNNALHLYIYICTYLFIYLFIYLAVYPACGR